MNTLKCFRLPGFLILLALAVWECSLSDQTAAANLLDIRLDDSLANYDSIRIDILYPNGTVYKDSLYYDKYQPTGDHVLRDLDLGDAPPSQYKIIVTGIRAGKAALVFSVPVTAQGPQPATILVRNIPTDSPQTNVDTVPLRIHLLTPSPLNLPLTAPATAIEAHVEPGTAPPGLTYSGFDTNIVSVDAAGNVRPLHIGETDILIASQRKPSVAATLHVKISQPSDVKGVNLTPDTLTLYAGGDASKLSAEVSPPESGISILFRADNDTAVKVDADGTVHPLKAGKAAIKVFPAGYPALFLTCNVTVVADPPSLDAGTDRQVRPNEPVTFPLAVSQKNGGVAALKWDLDGKNSWDDSVETPTANPTHTYDGKDSLVIAHFYVRDTEGNTITVDHIIKVSAKGPIVTITSPSEGYTTNAATVTVAWTIKPPEGATTTSNGSEKLGGKQGAIKIIREEIDAYGTKGADTVIIFRDTVAPAPPTFTAQTSPASVNAAYTSPVQWVWARSAPNDSFLVSLNGATAVKQAGTTYTLASPANGTYILDVYASDSAGNRSPAATRSIFVDKTLPPAPIVTGTTPTGSPTWTWSAAPGSDGNKIFRYKLSTASAYSAESNATSYSPTGLASGSYTLQVQERDIAGNWSGDGAFKIEVDKTAPSVAVGKPTPFGRVTSVNPTVSGSVSDEHGVKKAEYRINSGTYVPVAVISGIWSFTDNFDAGMSVVWIRGEDLYGNRDSTSIKIYMYPNVVFVRKNATGRGTSWDDALGELYQALDTTKNYAAGTQIWVTKGEYLGEPTRLATLRVPWSNFGILGGFNDKQPATDTSGRDFSYGATILGTRIYIGKPDEITRSVTVDGFSTKENSDYYLGVESRDVDEYITVKNFKVRDLLDDNGILNLYSKYNHLENCDFRDNNWSESGGLITLGEESEMLNCTLINNTGSGSYSPVYFMVYLTVRGGTFIENFGYSNGDKIIAHFDISLNKTLWIDNAIIQNGINGIYRGNPVAGGLHYGLGNREP